MKSPYNFVIKPAGERYNNIKKVGDKNLILNTEIYNHEYVNREGVVISCPIVGDTSIKPGDRVIVHHNVFRRWHNVRGVEKNSKAWFNKDTYIVSLDQMFLYNNGSKWRAIDGFTFVEPLKANEKIDTGQTEDPTKGVVVYTDGTHAVGDIVSFTPFSKYEFIIEGKKLYRVYNKFITIKYEYKGNEEAYNPSWA
jgi:hypothetical protein